MLRFATAPTGDMYIGTLRVAILNYLIAQQRQESFIVRIDDIDQASLVEGNDTEIMQILEKFALNHESVFHQSEHLHMHQTLAIRLLEEGKAFICTCKETTSPYSGQCFNVSKTEQAKLKEAGTPFVVRIKKPTASLVTHDLIKGDVSSTAEEVDSFVILDANGIPTPNFSSACDDMISGVDFILQEDTQLADALRQQHIKTQLGYDALTTYAHLPLIVNSDNAPLSKEDDAYLVKWLFEEGFTPDAIINYLLVLGNDNAPQNIFTLPEAIEWFKIEDISTTAAKFDIDALRHINAEHLRAMDDRDLSTLFGFADADIGKLAKIYLEEASSLKALTQKIQAIFTAKAYNSKYHSHMTLLEDIIMNADMIDSYDAFELYLKKESGLEGGNLTEPLRLLLTGAQNGPKLADIYPLIKPYLLEIATCTPSSTL